MVWSDKYDTMKEAVQSGNFFTDVIGHGVVKASSSTYSIVTGGRGFVGGFLAPFTAGLAAVAAYVAVSNYESGEDTSTPTFIAAQDKMANQGYIGIGNEFYPINKKERTAMSLTSLESGVTAGLEAETAKRNKVHTEAREARDAQINEAHKALTGKARGKARKEWGYDEPTQTPVAAVGEPVVKEPDYAARVKTHIDTYSGNRGKQ